MKLSSPTMPSLLSVLVPLGSTVRQVAGQLVGGRWAAAGVGLPL